jgi:hypothetical protein
MDNKECSPEHRRGESEWITRSVLLNTEEGKVNGIDYDSYWIHPRFINFALSML